MMQRWMIVLALIVSSSTQAHTTGSVKRTCPLSGLVFQAREDMSGTRFCLRYDLKPVGPTGAPPLLARCPDHDLVLYKDFSAADVEALRGIVTQPAFLALKNEHPASSAAHTMQLLGDDPIEVGWWLVMASWAVEGDDDRYRQVLGEAAEALHAGLSTTPDATSENARNKLLLLAEIRRLRGDFVLAARCLDTLERRNAGKDVPEIITTIIAEVRARIVTHDRRHAYLGAEQDRCRAADLHQQHEQQGRPLPSPSPSSPP